LGRIESSSSNGVINAGYHVCTTLGRGKIDVDIIGKPNFPIANL